MPPKVKKKFKCKNCDYLGPLLMAHLRKSQACQESYGDGYARLLELNKEKKKDARKKYLEKSKDYIKYKKAEYYSNSYSVIRTLFVHLWLT